MGAADSLFLFQSGCIFLPQFGYCLFEVVAAPFLTELAAVRVEVFHYRLAVQIDFDTVSSTYIY